MGHFAAVGLRTLAFVGAAVFMTTSPLAAKFSQVDGHFAYSIISATLVAELVKFSFSVLALVLLAVGQRDEYDGSVYRALRALCPFSSKGFLKYGVPSLVYMLNNNLVFVVLTFISATTFQILSCMKTIMTGVVMHLTGMKQLTRVQMAAVSLLACSIFIVSAGGEHPPAAHSGGGVDSAQGSAAGGGGAGAGGASSHGPARAHAENAQVIGLLLTLLTTTFSTAGGVYCEMLLKDERHVSIHWQNLQLYTWGVLMNAAALGLGRGRGGLEAGLLHGYTAATWVVVLNNAAIGLCISAVLKFLDNIARVYAHGFAMVATLLIEVALFSHAVEMRLVAAIWVICGSSYIYNLQLANKLGVSRSTQSDELDFFADAAAEAHDLEQPPGAGYGSAQHKLDVGAKKNGGEVASGSRHLQGGGQALSAKAGSKYTSML